MPHRTFTTEELTDYLSLARDDIERLMRESDLPYTVRGGRAVFQRGEIDAWASRRILGLTGKRLDVYHEKSMRGTQGIFPSGALIPELMCAEYIDLALTPRTRASAVRSMVALAARTGRVFDPRELLKSVEEREALCATALPGGLALLHARHHAEYRFDGSFVVLGRTLEAIPFGAPDGRPTQLFFLICCQDDRIHLHTLARLCLLAHNTGVIAQLLAAPNAAAAYDALVQAECAALPKPAEQKPAPSKRRRHG
jgi:mannitol/fructose-specific phosphotransferase system IIA component (Ntr-type)/predicted DNA-binding transcriptional regulator AlpA